MISKTNQFLKETRQELDKVTWPTKEETIKLTQTVIIVTVAFALYLGALDYLFTEGLNLLILKS
jgi:preprotein translocase subunit SecE